MPEELGKAVMGPVVVGKIPFEFTIDMNANGIPDYEEPEQLLKLLEVTMTAVSSVASATAPNGRVAQFTQQALNFIPKIGGALP